MIRLRPKRVISPECGHAHRAFVTEGPYWADYESAFAPVGYIHYVEWLAETLRNGKIKVGQAKPIKEPVTLQDSCSYVRKHGLAKLSREIMSYLANEFREMTSDRRYNYCCGGGSTGFGFIVLSVTRL